MTDADTRTYYRVVRHSPKPILEDFQSLEARGRRPPWRNPTPEQLASWRAVSTYVTEEAARAQALVVRATGRSIGDYIVRLILPAGAAVVIGTVNEEGHYDLSADAQVLLDAVVLPVTEVDR